MSRRQTWSLLLIAFGLFYLVPLSNHGLWIPDETRYAQISQAMLLGGGGGGAAGGRRGAVGKPGGRDRVFDRRPPGGGGRPVGGGQG
ncbi:hypothetical protein OFL53_25895, partial [Pseudomonas aeruginosa]|uniref:hypothetical protein n=1 Tax=Pseudomonas aeruginosa TaxID=287 RepID=UPI0021F0D0E3